MMSSKMVESFTLVKITSDLSVKGESSNRISTNFFRGTEGGNILIKKDVKEINNLRSYQLLYSHVLTVINNIK